MRKLIIFPIYLFFCFSAQADDLMATKNNILSKFSNSLASGIEGIFGSKGDTEVQITAGEDYHPEFSIMSVKPLATHPGVDAWFVQLQLNETKIRGDGRMSINSGIGYRKLSESKRSFTGANIFFDYDKEGNYRGSVGVELRSSAFEAIANYYLGLSDGVTVGTYTERTLDGFEISLIGEVPHLPWINIIANHYEWEAEKNSKNSEGEKLSLEMTIAPNFIFEAGVNNNNIDGGTNFVKAYLVFPPRKGVAATTQLISEKAFSEGDMSGELLTKVRRTNKQVIESEGSGVVMAKAN